MIDRGAAISDYLASEIWGEDKTPLGTGRGVQGGASPLYWDAVDLLRCKRCLDVKNVL